MSQAQQMIKHSTIYAIGNISRQIVGFIMLPIYTHYLTPADYGVVGLLIFLVSLFEIILGGHMFQAVPKYYHQFDDLKSKNLVVSSALIVTVFFSTIACMAMAFSSSILSEIMFGDSEYSIYVTIFSVLILTHALEQYGLTYLRIKKRPWIFFNYSMGKLFLQLSLNIITIVIMEMGLMGLAISSLLSSLIISIFLLTHTIINTGITLSRDIARIIIKFSWPLWMSGLVGLYIGSSNRYYVRIFSGLDDVGLFELASKFGAIVSVLVWLPFSQYWQTERFNIAKIANPYKEYSEAFRIITSLLLIIGLGVCLFSEPVILIMSDAAFHSAINAVPFLVLASIFQCLTIFNNFSFMFTEKTLEVTKNNLITALAITVFYFALIPYFGFVGASASLLLGSIAQYLYALHTGNKIYPLQIPQASFAISVVIFSVTATADHYLIAGNITVNNLLLKFILFLFSSGLVFRILFSKDEIQTLLNKAIRK